MLARGLKQKATYWEVTDDGMGGLIFGSPVVIKCRWENRIEEFFDATGERRASKAVVALDRELSTGTYLYKGESTAASPPAHESFPIRGIAVIPDLRYLQNLNVAYL